MTITAWKTSSAGILPAVPRRLALGGKTVQITRSRLVCSLSPDLSSPRLQRLFQFHAARRFQQYHIAFPSLARQPLAGVFRRPNEFRFHTRVASRFHHRLREAPHAEQKVKFTSRHITPALAMQFLAGRPEFQHLAGDDNPAPGGHGSQSIHRSHKRRVGKKWKSRWA